MISPTRLASIEAEMDQAGIRDIYDALVEQGEHPNMAAMLATQSAPGTWNTDTDFARRENERMSGMQEENRDTIVKIAQKHGINTHGKTYNGQLGRYSDPMAWVADTHDVKQAAMKKGLDIDGMVKVNGYKGPKKKVRIAEDILDRLEYQARALDPELNTKCKKNTKARKELRETLTNKHSKPKD